MIAPTDLFVIGASALALAAFLARGRLGPRAISIALGVLGAAFAALVLFERAGAALPAGSALAALSRTLGAGAALVLWGALCVLAFRRGRRRDLFWITPFGLLALLVLRDSDPSTGLALVLALPVVARWRWLDGIGRRTVALTLLSAILVPVLAFLPVPGGRALTGVPGSAIVRCAAWARELAGLYLLFALPGLLTRWSVGVRRVSRRLALLLLLSGVVPLLLVGILWGSTTVLGVSGERALIGVRLIEESAARLHSSLLQARGTPGPAALAALADAHPRWPGLRLWRDGARVRGDSIPGEGALATWPDTAMQHGLVVLGDSAWIGARVREAPGGTLVALLPARDLFRSDLDRLLGARLALVAGVEDLDADSLRASIRGLAGKGLSGRQAGDSLQSTIETIRENRRRDPSAVRFSLGQDTPTLSDSSFRLGAGHAVIYGMGWTGHRWIRAGGLLTVEVSWLETVAGLYRNTRENPFNVVLIAMVGLLVLLALLLGSANFGMVRALGRSITAAVAALRRGAGRLEAGDLAHRIPIEGQDDLWDVAAAFNRMAVGLERGRQLEIERQRIEDELALARRIQARLLPPGPPEVEGLELAGTSESAREVGGDYYDYLPLGDGRVALVIADVSGKGVGAALLMSGFRASLMSQDLANADPAKVLGQLNRFLHRSVEPGKFVTAFLGVLDGRSGRFVYCNAGHNAPLRVGADGAITQLETGGLILGILDDSPYEVGETVLLPGERLVLFTDGVTEAADESDEQWGEERLIELLRSVPREPCAGVVARIVVEVRRFEGARGASDDVTLIVARRAPGVSASS
jgi:serine phosphatase RsbU (regulator of sigma subunit)